MLKIIANQEVGQFLAAGKILLYPTEGVWGLGCDPFNLEAVKRLCQIKHRPLNKGLILIVANWQIAQNLVNLSLKEIFPSLTVYPTTTWLLPATAKVPVWIKGEHDQVAIRWCQHPFMQLIQPYWDQALVSTSANLAGGEPVTEFQRLDRQLLAQIDGCWLGKTGGIGKPSVIRDFLTKEVVRR